MTSPFLLAISATNETVSCATLVKVATNKNTTTNPFFMGTFLKIKFKYIV
jgi:hypothetical protein